MDQNVTYIIHHNDMLGACGFVKNRQLFFTLLYPILTCALRGMLNNREDRQAFASRGGGGENPWITDG